MDNNLNEEQEQNSAKSEVELKMIKKIVAER